MAGSWNDDPPRLGGVRERNVRVRTDGIKRKSE